MKEKDIQTSDADALNLKNPKQGLHDTKGHGQDLPGKFNHEDSGFSMLEVLPSYTTTAAATAAAADQSEVRLDAAHWLDGIQGAVFDMDGTLIDSMHYWQTLSRNYLESLGIHDFPADFRKRLDVMTVQEAAEWFVELYGLKQTPEEIQEGLNKTMENHYRYDVLLKPGIPALLNFLQDQKIPMAVATATDGHLSRMVLERLGIAPYFQAILSCEQRHTNKNKPDIYLDAAAEIEAEPDKTLVFEDAWHGIQTASQAGMPIAAIKDDSAAKNLNQILQAARLYIDVGQPEPSIYILKNPESDA